MLRKALHAATRSRQRIDRKVLLASDARGSAQKRHQVDAALPRQAARARRKWPDPGCRMSSATAGKLEKAYGAEGQGERLHAGAPRAGRARGNRLSQLREVGRRRTQLIRARKGVLIASGNFTYNLGMLQKYTPALAEGYQQMMRTGDMGDDGSGVELAQTVDGDVGNMDAVMVSRVISPPEEFYKGVLVNRAGKRMIHEDAYAGQVALPMMKEPGLAGWLVLDSKQFWKGIRQLMHPENMFSWFGLAQWSNVLLGKTRRARTLGELAAKCGIDGEGLEKSVRSYNTEPQTDPMLKHKLPENTSPIEHPPYYALDMALRNKANPSSGMPLGGLRVNEDTGNVSGPMEPISQGLYAAGRAAVGISHTTTFSGLTIADTIFAGRRAAKSILGGAN